jgi:hypothetical protein
MHEPSVALDPGAPGFSYWGSYAIIPSTGKQFVGVSPTLGFWSMRHSAISEEEVDFKEHCVGCFWLV